MSIYISKCAESNFKKLSESILFSLTFQKKVIREKSLSEKNILVGHIFSLCPINGKRQIFHKIFFLKKHFIIYLLMYNLIINYKKMYYLIALENSKILKKMLKITKLKKL
jgi:hypothetical protein